MKRPFALQRERPFHVKTSILQLLTQLSPRERRRRAQAAHRVSASARIAGFTGIAILTLITIVVSLVLTFEHH
jgi:hypothetical protein